MPTTIPPIRVTVTAPVTLTSATSRELEIEQVKRAIAKTDIAIAAALAALNAMQTKQNRRYRELGRQQAIAAIATNQS